MHSYDIVRRGSDPKDAGHALILLHGRGGSPVDMLELGERFVGRDWHLAAPSATNSTWYPYSFMAPRERNQPWLDSALAMVRKCIDELCEHMPAENIHLMGFSQGACLVTETAVRSPMRYGGIYAFTGGLIGEVIDPDEYSGDLDGTPVYLSNSPDDPHIPLIRSKETQAVFQEMGARVTLDIFPGRQHTIIQDEIDRARELMSITV